MAWPFSRRQKQRRFRFSAPRSARFLRWLFSQSGRLARPGNSHRRHEIKGRSRRELGGQGSRDHPANLLKRTGISQITVDTRGQAWAVSAPWRRTVDEKVLGSNSYGLLGDLPDYADMQGGAGINLLEAPELDPRQPLATDHLTVMGKTLLPAENDHQPYFPTASQALFISVAYGELVGALIENRKPLLANVRRKVLERSEYDANTGEPVKGMAFHARQILRNRQSVCAELHFPL